jgi:hypothetical protein
LLPNLPQASQFLGMTKWRVVAHLGRGGGGWTELQRAVQGKAIPRSITYSLLQPYGTLEPGAMTGGGQWLTLAVEVDGQTDLRALKYVLDGS